MMPGATKMEPKGYPMRPKWGQVGTKASHGDPRGSPFANVSILGAKMVRARRSVGGHLGSIFVKNPEEPNFSSII